jgi:beta-N-acetylhexosaminidase
MNTGQMFMLGFQGTSINDSHWIVRAIEEEQLGGVILFDRNVDGTVQNISSAKQLCRLTGSLQAIAQFPLLIGVDQEGGQVCRLKKRDGFPATLAARELAGLAEEEITARLQAMALTLSQAGVNFNLAPVVDMDINPDNPIITRYKRSFGANPDVVIRCARIFIKAHHEQNIACCLKHFPGHGSATADSHLGFVDITDHWQKDELVPFFRLIGEGMADAVMTAHLVNHHLDGEGLPATLSTEIINSLLRKKIGFLGVTISDDLQMRAITDKWGFDETVRRSVLAGVDILIIGNNLVREGDVLKRGKQVIRDMVDRGEVEEHYIESCLSRIECLKNKISGIKSW